MNDPLGVKTLGRLGVPCQIMHTRQVDRLLLLDIVTIGPCDQSNEVLPPGTVMALGFTFNFPDARRAEVDAIVDHWAANGTVVILEAEDQVSGIRYVFRAGRDKITLFVQ